MSTPQTLAQLETELVGALAARRRYFQIAHEQSGMLAQPRCNQQVERTGMLDEALDKFNEQSAVVMDLRRRISDHLRGVAAVK